MADISAETNLLNDLMEEVFGERPIMLGMSSYEAAAWVTKLQTHWIIQSRAEATLLAARGRMRFIERVENGVPRRILQQYHAAGEWQDVPLATE